MILSATCFGQRGDRTIQQGNSGQVQQKKVDPSDIDSINITTYELGDINKQDTFKTKGLTKYFQYYHPARQRAFEYGHLGNLGSSSYPFVLDAWKTPRYSLGLNQYVLYQKSDRDILFFKQKTPFSELFFTAGESQSDLRVKALFSRPFANNVNFVIQYDRISQDGIYQHQDINQTSLLSSLSYRPDNSRISAFFNFYINTAVEENNGGVNDLETLSTANLKINVPVNIEDAETRLQNQAFKLDFFYDLGNDTVTSPFSSKIQYEIKYFSEFFKFSDSDISSDQEFYGNYQIGDRGLRNFMDHKQIRNSIFFNSAYENLYSFKTGISYDYNAIGASSFGQNFHEVYLRFAGKLNLRKRFDINANAYYGLLNVANEFGIDARANLKLTQFQGFDFGFQAARYGTNYIQNKLVLNEQIFQEIIDPKKVILQTLSAEYYNTKYRIKLGGKLTNTFNYVYFNTEGLPDQYTGLFSTSLLYVSSDFKIKSFVFENFVFLQNQNVRLVNLPTAFTKNSISYYGKIFKGKMLVKAGIDFRYIFSDYVPKFQPAIGQFYLNETSKNKAYPLLDARISFKVSSFTTFILYENLTSLISDDYEFHVLEYPQFDARFRFGIQWNLWN